MSETSARHTLKKIILKECPGTHWQRVEDKTAEGFPDINICIPYDSLNLPIHGEYWIEAKFVEALPVRQTTPLRVGLRRLQCLWLRSRKAAGGKVRVILRVGLKEWWVWDDHFELLRDGAPAAELKKLTTAVSEKFSVTMLL